MEEGKGTNAEQGWTLMTVRRAGKEPGKRGGKELGREKDIILKGGVYETK